MNRYFKHFWFMMWLLTVLSLGAAQGSIYYKGKTIDTLREHVRLLQGAETAESPAPTAEPCVVLSDNMAECPLVGVNVHTKPHGPNDCPDGRQDYNSTGTYPDDYVRGSAQQVFPIGVCSHFGEEGMDWEHTSACGPIYVGKEEPVDEPEMIGINFDMSNATEMLGGDECSPPDWRDQKVPCCNPSHVHGMSIEPLDDETILDNGYLFDDDGNMGADGDVRVLKDGKSLWVAPPPSLMEEIELLKRRVAMMEFVLNKADDGNVVTFEVAPGTTCFSHKYLQRYRPEEW